MGLLNFDKFPRYMGCPRQVQVQNVEDMMEFISQHNGLRPIYVSAYSFPNDKKVYLDKVPFDFDSALDLQPALDDARKLVKWHLDLDKPIICPSVFTGGRGFQSYIPLKESLITRKQAHKHLQAIQTWHMSSRGLMTADRRIVGDERRILRMPWCVYADKNNKKTGSYSIVLWPQDLLNTSLEEITELSKDLDEAKAFFRGGAGLIESDLLTAEDYIEKYGIVPMNLTTGGEGIDTMTPYNHFGNEYVKALFPRPCIHNQLLAPNPKAFARVCSVIHLKKLGWNMQKMYEFYKGLNWDDFSPDKTCYNIEYVVRRYKFHPSCTKIKENGICVGKVCDKYKEDY